MANNPWRRSDSNGAGQASNGFTTWNSSYGASQTAGAMPRVLSGRVSPGQSGWARRDPRSLSVPPPSPTPISSVFAPVSPIPQGHSAKLQVPPSSGTGRPRLGSSPAQVFSAGSPSRHSGASLPTSPTHANGSFLFSPEKTNPAKITLIPDHPLANAHSPTSLPPMRDPRAAGFQRRHSSPSLSPDEVEEHIVVAPMPSISPMPSPQKSQLHLRATPPSSPRADSASSLHQWKKGTDRPKTSHHGKKPIYGLCNCHQLSLCS